MYIIGIDPGVSGAVACLDTLSGILVTLKFKGNEFNIIQLIGELNPTKTFAVLEKVHAMPGQGVTSMFTFGSNFGWWNGILQSLNIEYQMIDPKTWQKDTFRNVPEYFEKVTIDVKTPTTKEKQKKLYERKRKRKLLHIEMANKLLKVNRIEHETIKHDGVADAVLMMYYAKDFILNKWEKF